MKKKTKKAIEHTVYWWVERLRLIGGVVPTKMVDDILGKEEAKRFWKWMGGQTMSIHGVYEHDLKTYIYGRIKGYGEPYVWD